MPEEVRVAEQISEVVGLALRARNLAALEKMLREVALLCGGFGVALWRERLDLPDGRLFVLAHGFLDSKTVCAFDALPGDRATSQCLKGVPVEVLECATDERIDKDSEFYRRERPASLLSLPVIFQDEVRGAVTLYRRAPGAFSSETRRLFGIFAGRVADLYHTILDR
ncbi:MAG: GAF domain-containing protein, partial [Bryobacterales bacterium]|nr:GAF domain-containing protein [Bryobacterales bacterium]